VYVVGGLVDRKVVKMASLRRAGEYEVETARIPLKEWAMAWREGGGGGDGEAQVSSEEGRFIAHLGRGWCVVALRCTHTVLILLLVLLFHPPPPPPPPPPSSSHSTSSSL